MTMHAENPVVAVWSSGAEDEDEGDELLTALLASARDIAAAERVADALPRIAQGAAAMVPDVRDAGVALRARGKLACGGHTTETAAQVDQAQIGTEQGPCIDAVAGAGTVTLPNAATETRWPRFVPEAVRHGVRASLSVRLTSRAPVGALNLHVTRHALDDRAARVRTQRRARMFVAYASLALAGTDRVENLEKAVVSRDVIGQAKGILMNQYDVDADEAFARLRRASQTTNVKLYDVAAWVVACRTL